MLGDDPTMIELVMVARPTVEEMPMVAGCEVLGTVPETLCRQVTAPAGNSST